MKWHNVQGLNTKHDICKSPVSISVTETGMISCVCVSSFHDHWVQIIHNTINYRVRVYVTINVFKNLLSERMRFMKSLESSEYCICVTAIALHITFWIIYFHIFFISLVKVTDSNLSTYYRVIPQKCNLTLKWAHLRLYGTVMGTTASLNYPLTSHHVTHNINEI